MPHDTGCSQEIRDNFYTEITGFPSGKKILLDFSIIIKPRFRLFRLELAQTFDPIAVGTVLDKK